MEKSNELSFLEEYENAKQRIRARENFVNFGGDIREIIKNGEINPARKYLREIGIIQEAFQRACYNI